MEQVESEKQDDITKIQGDISLLNDHFNQLSVERRVVLNEYMDLKGNIRVFCRIRPPLQDEIHRHESPIVTCDSSKVILNFANAKSKQYCFDKVLHPSSTQDEVFTEIEPVIKSALDGYNVSIFAYGQTGTGKTYTMEGKTENPGIVPRVIHALFEQASECNFMLEFTFSMLEIYMGSIRDLLVPQSRKLMFHKRPSLIRISISSLRESGRREEKNKIWMVDLGGSERLLKTQASGRRLEEGKAINLSLSALGDVISALHCKKTHVPYRNSKLTQVLRDCLGSDSKTLMLLHVSPKEVDICETVCSLAFATRVKNIHLGSEESAVNKAKKELAMSELLQKIKDIEHERHEVKKKTENLYHKQQQLLGPEPSNERKLESSHEHVDLKEPKKVENLHNAKGSTRKLNVPRFMRPTVCSQKKTSYHHVSPADNKKPPIIHKKQKPMSVYADSIHGSECSNSAISNANLEDIEDDGTECSLETSEYEIKEVIFLEPEKSHINEVDYDQASKLHMKNDIANWIQLDMNDQKSLHTVPAEVTNLSTNNEYIPIIIKDVCKENIRVMNINTEKSAECTAYDEDAEEINILLVRSKNSPNHKDLEQIDEASLAVGNTTLVHIANLPNSQEEKHERGTVEILRKSVQMFWNCTLLALGIQDIGFGNEFFQGLLL